MLFGREGNQRYVEVRGTRCIGVLHDYFTDKSLKGVETERRLKIVVSANIE